MTQCKFGNIHSQAILVPTEDDDDQATILCYTPPGNQLTIGSYPVEVQFSCLYNNNFTHNRVPFQVTRTKRFDFASFLVLLGY